MAPPLRVLSVAVLLVGTASAPAQERARETRSAAQKRRQQIGRGLDYLARNQNVDGSFGRLEAGKVGITSLCLLAFMAQGHHERRGRYSSFKTAAEAAGT